MRAAVVGAVLRPVVFQCGVKGQSAGPDIADEQAFFSCQELSLGVDARKHACHDRKAVMRARREQQTDGDAHKKDTGAAEIRSGENRMHG